MDAYCSENLGPSGTGGDQAIHSIWRDNMPEPCNGYAELIPAMLGSSNAQIMTGNHAGYEIQAKQFPLVVFVCVSSR